MMRMSKTTGGVIIMVLLTLAGLAVFNKEQISTRVVGLLTPTETVTAEFARDYKLREYRAGSAVKMAGIQIGTITHIAKTPQGTSKVTMQVDNGIREKLGNAPKAVIRATLIVGGRYYVDLVPGGTGTFTDDGIPLARTEIPVELERVLDSFGSDPAIKGIRSSVKQVDGFLQQGGTDALRGLVQDAPNTLRPTGDVLTSFEGTRPGRDLTDLVVGLRNTSAALDSRDGQIESIIGAVDGSTNALAAGSGPLAESIADMPETMRATRAGLDDLNPTLDQLVVTAKSFQPSAEALGPMLDELDPVLDRARPLLSDVRPLLEDAKPLVERLSPVTRDTTTVLDDVGGSVLDRVNGPIIHTVLAPWKGEGVYQGGGASGNPLYKETGYLVSRASQVFGWHDKNGSFTRLSAGVASNAPGSTSHQKTLEQLLEQAGAQQPAGPQAFAGQTSPVPPVGPAGPDNPGGLGKAPSVPGLAPKPAPDKAPKAPAGALPPTGGSLLLPGLTDSGAHR